MNTVWAKVIFSLGIVVFSSLITISVCGRIGRHVSDFPDQTRPWSAKEFQDDFGSDQIKQEKMAAVSGSAKAAGALTQRYLDCVSSLEHDPSTKGLPRRSTCYANLEYWLQIGAENDDLGSILMRIDQLVGTKSCHDANRAEFWLSKATRLSKIYDVTSRRKLVEQAKLHCRP